jgi:hypothetical protein
MRSVGLNPKTPDFIPPGFTLKDVTYHNIISRMARHQSVR